MQDERKDIVTGLNESASQNIWLLYIAIFLLILAVAFLFVYYKFLREPLKRSQRRKAIFNRFSTANELSNQESNYLKQVAIQYRIQNPYLIFVRRSVFEDAAGRVLANNIDIGTLRDKLYRPE